MTPHLKNLVNLRWKAYRSRDFLEYNRLKRSTHLAINHAKQNWARKSQSNSKGLWRTVNEINGKRCGKPLDPILAKYPNKQRALDNLNLGFIKAFGPKENVSLPDDVSDWAPLASTTQVFDFLERLKLNKSTGSDGIRNFFFRLASPFLCQPLCHIINSSVIHQRSLLPSSSVMYLLFPKEYLFLRTSFVQ